MRLIISILILVLAGHAHGEPRPDRCEGNFYGPSARSSVDLSLVTDLVGQVGSVSALLSRFPESYRQNHVLMYESRSLQPASFTDPRAIFYGEDASFLTAIHGGVQTDSRGEFRTLEFVSQNPRTKAWEFYQVEERNGSLTLSDKNPAECLACHGTPPHPIWEPYPRWRGAYFGANGSPIADEEPAGLQTFVERLQNAPGIYAQIPGLASVTGSQDLRYLGGKSSQFNNFLARANWERFVQRLVEAEKFHPLKFAVLAAINKCENLEEFFTAQERAARGPLSDHMTFVQRRVFGDGFPASPGQGPYPSYHQRDRESYDPGGQNPYGGKAIYPQVAGLRYVLQGTDIAITDFELTLESGTYAHMTPAHGAGDMQCAMMARDPRLADLVAASPLGEPEALCTALLQAHQTPPPQGEPRGTEEPNH